MVKLEHVGGSEQVMLSVVQKVALLYFRPALFCL